MFLCTFFVLLFFFPFPSTPTGVETPDVIDLRKQQRKEPEKPLYQVRVSVFVVLIFIYYEAFSKNF